jgi:hypothetical protein
LSCINGYNFKELGLRQVITLRNLIPAEPMAWEVEKVCTQIDRLKCLSLAKTVSRSILKEE